MKRPSRAALNRPIDGAVVDACGEAEQITGFLVALGENPAFPFPKQVQGVEASVIGVEDVQPDALTRRAPTP